MDNRTISLPPLRSVHQNSILGSSIKQRANKLQLIKLQSPRVKLKSKFMSLIKEAEHSSIQAKALEVMSSCPSKELNTMTKKFKYSRLSLDINNATPRHVIKQPIKSSAYVHTEMPKHHSNMYSVTNSLKTDTFVRKDPDRKSVLKKDYIHRESETKRETSNRKTIFNKLGRSYNKESISPSSSSSENLTTLYNLKNYL